MPKYFVKVEDMQKHLKETIARSRIEEIVRSVMRDYIDRKVYQNYTPEGVHAYDRTYELINAVDIVDVFVGTKHYTFEVFLNPALLTSDANRSETGDWNAHASMPQGGNSSGYDTTEFIPLWIEKGTNGSLWDREGAYYNNDTYMDLDTGQGLVNALIRILRKEGFNAHLED